MDNDDSTIGKILTRREAMGFLGGSTLATVIGGAVFSSSGTASASPVLRQTKAGAKIGQIVPCVLVSPAQTEGPFFVDEGLNRSDVRADVKANSKAREGMPLELVMNLIRVGAICNALEGATVDIWHCDAAGLYSDVRQNGTEGQKFLRGYQTSNSQGQVKFQTIYPGWYQGRTVHIHFKIRYQEGDRYHEFTSQLYFDDMVTDAVHSTGTYKGRGMRDLRNAHDGIYSQGGNKLMLALSKTKEGYRGQFNAGLVAA